jgi:hypothetical protein
MEFFCHCRGGIHKLQSGNIISYQMLKSRVFSGASSASGATGEKEIFLQTVSKNVTGKLDHAVEIWIDFLLASSEEASEHSSRNVEQPLFLEGFKTKKEHF